MKPINGSTRAIRCPARKTVGAASEPQVWWCSRDKGHYGAHESRADAGPGLIAWWNDEYPRLQVAEGTDR